MLEFTTIINGSDIPWVNGSDAFATMVPEFRDNFGGDSTQVEALLRRYWIRALWLDPATTRRIDHVRTDPGYIDLSEAYHDSVEESYLLNGAVQLSAEGDFAAGDYFWRPPGWVHSAKSSQGFEGILMMEGESPSEGSGRVSRVILPDHEVGHNALFSNENRIGPRGYVRRKETRYMVWRPHDDNVTGLGSTKLMSKVLSRNVATNSATILVALPAGTSLHLETVCRDRFLICTSGTITVDDQRLDACSLIHNPAGVTGPRLNSAEGAEILVKVGEER